MNVHKRTGTHIKHVCKHMETAVNTYFQHTHFIPIVGVGKRDASSLVHGDAKAAPVTGTTLRFTDPVPADSRQ